MKKKFILFFLGAVVLVSGCAGVTRVETDKVVDLSGKWNDTDSRFVAEAMIEDCLKRPWLGKFKDQTN
ncbi:MAG: penicillin-binding protein activator LpoB, partial [Nitrospinota bacterium]